MTIYYPRRETSEYRGHKHAQILNMKELLIHLFLYMHVCICIHTHTNTHTHTHFRSLLKFFLFSLESVGRRMRVLKKFSQGIKKI